VSAGRALVLGGGVVGVSAAYYLARAGWQVSVLDKDDVCAGSSYGNAGLLVPSHAIPLAAPGALWTGLTWMLDPASPFYVKPRLDPALLAWLWRFGAACTAAHVRRAGPVLKALSEASLQLYDELARLDGLEFGYRRDGLLKVFRTAAGWRDGRAEARRLEALGIAVTALDGDAARALEPSLRPDVAGALFFEGDAHLTPDRFVRGLARVAGTLDAQMLPRTEVLGFVTAGRRIRGVETTRGDFEADEVVLATGAWSPGLLAALRLRLPIQAAKGYSVTCRRPAGAPRRPLLLGEARVAVTPMGETLRLAGTLELAGLDLSIDRRRVEAVRQSAGRYLALGEEPIVTEVWRGLRPCTPDGLPALGRPRRLDNLIVATGHAMLGVSLGPITGRLVAQLACGQAPALDLTPLDPDRF
jgi:D-amino-acid dehydrogenase